ncbi:cold-shock protein [Rhodobaculum claviforme]|uniref:Cold-shock protein n=1 Tax=Rhodobaculum claviforme TaxID=1549854 RepID=A0A934TK88_9RHOB|nr:cold shock domain-containing protein [Rhodobaculum claviforme]MBK5927066.1 cold-shock protein [Rhodobaculum claviforme]
MSFDSANLREPRSMKGKVKWFDAGKGFGFILPEDGSADVLLHANVLRAFGQGAVSDGAEIEVLVQETTRGLQAVEVLKIVPPPMPPTTDMAEVTDIDAETLAGLALEPARVKWFDRARGFGFANVFGKDGDVFVHIEVLRRSGFAEVQPGEAICLRCIDGRRGRMAVLVTPWEAAISRGDGDPAA